jgi:predicted transcriptional regulator
MKPVNFTSSLPSDLLQALDNYAQKFKVPKNRIMEQALRAYFERLKQAEYSRSFKKAAGDVEMATMAEEGLEDYLKILDEA